MLRFCILLVACGATPQPVTNTPMQPLDEARPFTSEELFERISQTEFSLANNDAQVDFNVGLGLERGFELVDIVSTASFRMRTEDSKLRVWALHLEVPGGEVVVPPGSNDAVENRFTLRNIRIRLTGDAVAPIVFADYPKASATFRMPLVINADMGTATIDSFPIELTIADVGVRIDFDVVSRRLLAHVQVNEASMLYGRPDGLFIDGMALDSELQGVMLPSTWLD